MKQARHNSGDPRFTILMRPVQQNNPVIQEIRHVRCQVVLQTEIFLLLPCFNLVGTFLRVLRYFVSLSLHRRCPIHWCQISMWGQRPAFYFCR